MALEALGFPNDHMQLFNYTNFTTSTTTPCKDLLYAANTFGNSSSVDDHPNYMEMMPKMVLNGTFPSWETSGGGNSHAGSSIEWDSNSSSTSNNLGGFCPVVVAAPPLSSSGVVAGNGTGIRRKRRRSKGCKNKEEVENQRMTHIAVERNRRKQMNEYLAVLRSLMPASYVQRGDQASIVGGAINFVKELEQLLQTLEARKSVKSKTEYGTIDGGNTDNNADLNSTSSTMSSLFGDLFSLNHCRSPVPSGPSPVQRVESVVENKSAVADVEVTLVESHANVKILSRRRPRQLLKIIGGFQSLNLTVLHLNVTSVEDMVLYSMSAKVEEECQISSVDEIASAVHQIMGRIHADQDSLTI